MTLNVSSVSLTYERAKGGALTAISDIDLTIQDGEFVSLIGPSGCGKSTLLHCMGGMLKPTAGTITVDDVQIAGPKPSRGAFVFQDYSLFPWRSVVDNAATGLRFAGVNKSQRRAEAMKQLELVGLDHVAESYPAELSGGMQQRVAVARALAMDPPIMLMDEPFGALDEQSRRRIGVEMSTVLAGANKTVVMVTHSLDEAIFWADRVLVMGTRPGRIVREFVVDAPRPRRVEFMTTSSFDGLRASLFELLENAPETAAGAVIQ